MILTITKKHITIASVCSILIICVVCSNLILNSKKIEKPVPTNNKPCTNWGLSFAESGRPPTGNATTDSLKNFDSYFIGNTSEKKIYLTFDAGYENGFTPSILDTLAKHNVKASFFVVGNYITTSTDLIKRMLKEGHIVGNHTNTHPDMSKISDIESFKKEIFALEKLYKEATGQDIKKFYRPPGGKYSESNLAHAKELGYKTIFWSLAYVDWYVDRQPSKEEAFKKLIPRIHPGAVVLLHSTSKTNASILDELITKWKEQGYTFESLDMMSSE